MTEKIKLYDAFEANAEVHWEMNEYAASDKKVVDGNIILARVEGRMFAPDGDSLNGRHYTRGLWEKAIARNQDRLKANMVLGTLGHDTEINDTTLGEGKISHKVVRMWIDEKTGAGMGEIHVLGTDSGRALNALLRGGVQLQVSTRATGELTNRKSSSGLPIIDEDSYSFQGIDFVSKGGIPEARPRLVEADKEPAFHPNVKIEPEDIHIENTNSPIKETQMSEKLLTDLATEKGKLKEALDEALSSNKKINEDQNALRSDLRRAQADNDRTVEMLENSKARVTDLEGKLADAAEIKKQYEKFGDVEKMSEELANTKALVEKYSAEFGTYEELTETYSQAELMVEEFEKLGSPQAFAAVIDEAEGYRDLGTVDELTEKLALLAKFEEVASLEETTTGFNLLKSYAPLGTPEEIEETLSAMERATAHLKAQEVKADATDIAKKFKMKVDRVEEMLVKMGKESTVEFLEDLFKEPEVANRYTVSGRSEKTNEAVLENNPPVQKSRADMLLERLGSKHSPSQNNFTGYEK